MMFNSHISTRGLLPESPDTGILRSYNKKACIRLCQTIIDGVEAAPFVTVATASHLRFAMESIGFSFSLCVDLHTFYIIQKAIVIYSTWLNNCPDCAKSAEDKLRQDIFCHFSFIFYNSNESALDGHSNLAIQVIEVMHLFIIKHGNSLHWQTWNVLLRVLLGSCDCLFEQADFDVKNLGSTIIVPLIRLVFEAYVRSLPCMGCHIEVWELLDSYVKRWSHRIALIKQWNNICACFTLQMIEYLNVIKEFNLTNSILVDSSYSTSGDVKTIHIEFPINWKYKYLDEPYVSHVLLDPQLFKFCWNRLIHCLGNPNHIISNALNGFKKHFASVNANSTISMITAAKTEVITEAMRGICALADMVTHGVGADLRAFQINTNAIENVVNSASTKSRFSDDNNFLILNTSSDRYFKYSKELKNFPVIVDGNTCLMLFGGWLFDAALKISSDVTEEARSLAITALGRIFGTSLRTDNFSNSDQQGREKQLLPYHTQRFILSIRYALNVKQAISYSKDAFVSTLVATQYIFGISFRASSILVPLYISAIDILVKYNIEMLKKSSSSSSSMSTSGTLPSSSGKVTNNNTPSTGYERATNELVTLTYGKVFMLELRKACIHIMLGFVLNGM